MICKMLGAVTPWLMGFPDAASRQSAMAIQMSEDLSPGSQAVAFYFAAMVHQLRRDMAATRKCAATCHAIAREHGFSFWRAGSAMLLGWAAAAEGNTVRGAEARRQSLIDWQATGSITYRTYFLGILAETLLLAGQAAEARKLLEESLAFVERTGERFFEAELHRLLGESLLGKQPGQPELTAAESCLQRALRTAQRQKVRLLELRANISQVQLAKRRGAATEPAERALRDNLDWFSQGHDTPDLRLARAVCDAH